MAFNLYPQSSTTVPEAVPQNGYGDLLVQDPVNDPQTITLDTTTLSTGDRQFELGSVPMAWWSPRVATSLVLSGTYTFTLRAHQTVADATLKLRFRLSKITAGGSAVESPVLEADAPNALAVGSDTLHTITGEMPTAVTLYPNERLIVRLYAFHTGGGFGSGTVSLTYNYDDTVAVFLRFEDVGDSTDFRPNITPLYLRNTAVAGIGAFLDLLETPGGGAVVDSVATTAGGTEVTWTRGVTVVTADVANNIVSTGNVTTYSSVDFTPLPNRLYLVAVVHSDAAPEATIPTVSSTTGLTFVQVATVVFDTIASNVHRLTVFRAMKASGLGMGLYTVTLADAGTGCVAVLAEASGVNVTGTDGANAIRNVTTGNANAGANPSITMGAFAQTYHAVVAFFGSDIVTRPTPETNYQELTTSAYQYATPNTGLFAEWKPSSDTTPSCTLASSDWGGIAVELVAPAAPANLEWVSERFTQGWVASAASQFSGALWASESSAAANTGARVKVFHRTPTGTETLVYTWTTGSELLTAPGLWDLSGGTLNNAVTFHEDDRLVVRLYLTNVGTMAAGHFGMALYDAPGETDPAVDGNSYLSLFATFQLKPETQGDSRITDGQSMGGVGN